VLLARQSNGGPDAPAAPCAKCGRPTDPFGRCRRRTCAGGFFTLWAGDTRCWVHDNAQALSADGRIDMLTLTAPGEADGLPWDRSLCSHDEGQKCSGKLGCRVLAPAAQKWNGTAPANLTAWLNAAHTRVCRELNRRRPEWLGIWEEQERGVLHAHLLFAAKDRRYVERLAVVLREIAPAHMWGQQVHFRPCAKGRSRGAAYLFKTVSYVTKSAANTAESAQLLQLLDGPLKGRPFMRASPKLTARSKTTMRNLRYRRYLVTCRGVGGGLPCEAVEIIRRLDEKRRDVERQEQQIVRSLKLAFGDPEPFFRCVEKSPVGFDPSWRSLPAL
jgi:hypothetical protein